MNALDALITAGHADDETDIDWKVIRDIARMLGRTRAVPSCRRAVSPPATAVRRTRCRRGRCTASHGKTSAASIQGAPAPGVLATGAAPSGRHRRVPGWPEGVACIGRRRRFRRREMKAIRTVLRFLGIDGETGRKAVDAVPRGPKPAPALAGEGLIGESRAWQRVLDQVARVAQADCAVVLEGETGTGKERLARSVHSASHRSQGPFVAVNCGAIAPELLASELFGHIRGAYTGAHRSRQGLIRRAHRGTLFLDEVADMPPTMQVALLRVLEEGHVVVPVGSVRSCDVNVRVLCATHKSMSAEVAAGRFREDLFHRLNVVSIQLPPLREREADLVLLAEHLLGRIDPPCRLHADSYAVLARYAWPGNVRELDNVLRAAALLADEPEITPESLRGILGRRRERAARAPLSSTWGPRTEALLGALGSRWLSSSELASAAGRLASDHQPGPGPTRAPGVRRDPRRGASPGVPARPPSLTRSVAIRGAAFPCRGVLHISTGVWSHNPFAQDELGLVIHNRALGTWCALPAGHGNRLPSLAHACGPGPGGPVLSLDGAGLSARRTMGPQPFPHRRGARPT